MRHQIKSASICATVSAATFVVLGIIDRMILLHPAMLLEYPVESYGLVVLSVANGAMAMLAYDKRLGKIFEALP